MENIVKQVEQELNAESNFELNAAAKSIVKEILEMKQSLQKAVDTLQISLQEFTDADTPAELEKLVHDYDIILGKCCVFG